MQKEKSEKYRYAAVFAAMGIVLILAAAASLFLGSVKLVPGTILRVLSGAERDSLEAGILLAIRLPRMAAAIVLGGALALSGFLMQSFFGNPIAGPFILGISSGSKLMVAITMIVFISQGTGMGSAALIAAAFVGALFSIGFVLLISGYTGKSSMLIISGVMIGYICSAVTDILVTFASDSDIVNLHNWSMGSFSGIGWDDVRAAFFVTAMSCIFCVFLAKPMTVYQLGEEYAENAGVSITLFRTALIVISGLLAAAVTAFAGPISFVGVAVPHVVKGLLRTSRPALIMPASFLGGAICCLVCDLIARMAFSPNELSISSVTALFGAPVVIWIMLRRGLGNA